MTEYELQTLTVAKSQLLAYWGADIIAALALIAAVFGARIALRSLRGSQLNTLLLFEQDMANRRTRFHDIGADMDANPGAPAQALQARFNEAKESYFNSLERLASSILSGAFSDAEMKHDYHEVITEVVRAFPGDFATGTRYRKIVKLHNRWQDQT